MAASPEEASSVIIIAIITLLLVGWFLITSMGIQPSNTPARPGISCSIQRAQVSGHRLPANGGWEVRAAGWSAAMLAKARHSGMCE